MKNLNPKPANIKIEYEAKFINIDKEKLRKKLKEIGAKLVKPEFLQRGLSFICPKVIK